MTDIYKKYKKVINVPQEFMGDGFKSIKNWKPDNNWKQLIRVPGATIAFNLYLALWLFTKIGLENPIIEKMTDNNEKKKVNNDSGNFFKRAINAIIKQKKKSPNASAFIAYYMMLLSLVGAGKITYDNSDKIKEFAKEWSMKFNETEREKNFGAYKNILEPITPWLIAQLIAAEGVHMNAQGLHTPYLDSNNIWTIGFGNTKLKDGSSVTATTKPITTEEAYELARWHLEELETFFYLYCYSVADPSLTVRNTGEAFGLASVMYNSGTKFIEDKNDRNHKERFAELRKEYMNYGNALPDSIVLELFKKYPIRKKESLGKAWMDSHDPEDMAKAIGLYMLDGRGMHWRRWLEAGLVTGDVNPKDLLECPIKGMYDFYLYMGGKKESLWEKNGSLWQPKKSTYQAFKQWLANPTVTRQKVKDFLPADILQECIEGRCEIGVVQKKRERADQIEKKTYTIGYEDAYNTAIYNYKQKNYNAAIQILENLSETNPNNALLHNDLALMYNKTGQYQEAIKHAQFIVRQIGDKSQYGAAQYNAGYAYEQLGDLQKALQNYKLALSNGNDAAREAIKRVRKNIQKQKSKATAFNDGVLKIHEKQNQSGNTYFVLPDNDYTA